MLVYLGKISDTQSCFTRNKGNLFFKSYDHPHVVATLLKKKNHIC